MAVLLLVVWTALAGRGPRWVRGSAIFGVLLLLSLAPAVGDSWLQWKGVLADRTPLLSLWLLICAVVSSRGPLVSGVPLAAERTRLLQATSIGLLALFSLLPAEAQIVGERAMARAHDPEEDDPEGRLAEAADARPWDSEPWFLLGGVAMQLEDWDQARTLQSVALMADPNHVDARVAAWLIEMLDPDGDAEAGFVHLEVAESLAPDDPTVQEARPRWLSAIRDRHEQAARQAVAQGSPRAQAMLCSIYLTEARIALLRGEGAEMIERKLSQSAAFAGGSMRLQLERLARDPEVDEATLAAVTAKIWPDWPTL